MGIFNMYFTTYFIALFDTPLNETRDNASCFSHIDPDVVRLKKSCHYWHVHDVL